MHKAYSTAQEAYCKEQETYWAEVTIFIFKYIRVWALGEKNNESHICIPYIIINTEPFRKALYGFQHLSKFNDNYCNWSISKLKFKNI